MIEVKVNIVPFGDRKNEREIASMLIVNNGTGTRQLGNYHYQIEKGTHLIEGTIKEHNRFRNIFNLIYKILDKEYAND